MPPYTYGAIITEEIMAGGLSAGPYVSVIMGSDSDWGTVQPCCDQLEGLGIPFEYGVVSAHRTHERLMNYVPGLANRSVQVLIAMAGGSSHLQGMSASMTTIPVLAFGPSSTKTMPSPVIDSCIYMPGGVPLAFMGIDKPGAINAALAAARIIALSDSTVALRLRTFIQNQTDGVPRAPHQ
jgi:5-(carboxyamino)imidazole ribonucleotide mutase